MSYSWIKCFKINCYHRDQERILTIIKNEFILKVESFVLNLLNWIHYETFFIYLGLSGVGSFYE